MRYHTVSDFSIGPEFTPPTIQSLIIATCSISIAATIGTTVLFQLLAIIGPEFWLSLSWQGLKNYYVWQPVTYLFVQYTSTYGFSFSYFINLLFQMYLLWVIGSQVLDRIGRSAFLRLYFISGILAGLITVSIMAISGYYDILSGPFPSILAIMVIWTLMYPEQEILLFFLIPVKAKWLILGFIGVLMLVSIPADFLMFILYFFSCLIGYLYGIIAWGLKSPFPVFRPFEGLVLKCVSIFSKKEPKVLDISTGEPKLDDDRFVDAMLEKISKKGEHSLSWQERQRMKTISERKREEKVQKH